MKHPDLYLKHFLISIYAIRGIIFQVKTSIPSSSTIASILLGSFASFNRDCLEQILFSVRSFYKGSF